MKYLFKTSYFRSLKKLDSGRQKTDHQSFTALVDFFQTGQKTSGLGLKKLQFDFWEIRAGLLDRIIFRRVVDTVELVLVGTHDEIKRYLKNI